MSLNGYDISNNQGDINNGEVPGDFVIIKATEGVGWTDPNCDANYQQAKKAGKRLGVYHYARPDGNGATAEADWFVSQVKGYQNDAVWVLDLEVQPITADWAKEWLDRVYALSGIRPWIYLNQSTANNPAWSIVWKDYPLWVAAYGRNARVNGYTPSTDIGVGNDSILWNIIAWQYTSNGYLPNWGGRLDLNVFYGDGAAWDKYAGRTVLTPPPTEVHPPQPDPVPIPTPETPPANPNIPIPAPTPTAPIPTPTPPTSNINWKVLIAAFVGAIGAIIAAAFGWLHS